MPTDAIYERLGRKKVLLAEDVELNQYLARHIMESWGFDVEIANNGLEAVNMFEKGNYDLILMDIQMPEMDGIEATKRIRSSDPKIPIIALTANVLKGDGDTYKSVGMNDYVPKPFDEKILFSAIEKTFSAQSDSHNTTTVIKESEPEVKSAPLYDLTMVQAISGGDQEFVRKMLRLFLDTIPGALTDFENAFKAQQWEQLGKLAHKMKSTIDSMSIVQLKQDIRAIEQNGKQRNESLAIDQLVSNVITIMNRCMDQVRKDYSM